MTRADADAWSLYGVIASVTLFCAAGLYRVLAGLLLHLPLDPNEGWNAYHAADAMSGAPLYPGTNVLFFNNYPPLSFYLVGALGNMLGDNIVAGRCVSLMSFAATVVLIALIAKRMRVGVLPWIVGALFFTSVLLLFSDYVGLNDPQLLGHALQFVGLFVVLGEPRRTQTTILAAFLFIGALFVKHNLVVLPLATIVWLALKYRADAVTLAGACIVLGAIGLILFRIAGGSGVRAHLASARGWSMENMLSGVAGERIWAAVLR